ncbi:RNA-dependent RNA polymerase 1 [Spatholobus suberectus]|nr:RNA-dependent RNA polymerase 1 [Spatholobus suberectus]
MLLWKLDVLAWSKYKPCYLNRQIITLLSTLGVKDRVFRKKQREIINQMKMISRKRLKGTRLDVPRRDYKHFKGNAHLICGFHSTKESFPSMMLQTLYAGKFQESQLNC